MAEKKRIAVATSNADKVESTRLAGEEVFGGEVHAFGVPGVESNIPEQPYGYRQTLKGARNRAANARRILAQQGQEQSYDVLVAIESGVMRERGQYKDRSVSVAQDNHGNEGVGRSRGVVFPTEYVEEAQKQGTNVTVGTIIKKERGGSNQDPHLTLTGTPRRDYLQGGTRSALRNLGKKQRGTH